MYVWKRVLRRRFLPLITAALLVFFFVVACGVAGNVVKITEVEGNPSNDLKENLQELRKKITQKDHDEVLSSIIEKTPQFTVSEYLLQYPEYRGLAAGDYKVGGYDVLSITIYEEKELSRESVRVSGDGYLSFPLIGRLRVADMTTAEIEKLVSRQMAEGQYLFDAHVSVMVVKYESQKFSALGAVKSPGNYPIQARERVLDGIGKAGGIDIGKENGEIQEAMIIRTLNIGREAETKIVIKFDLSGLLKGSDQNSNIFLADRDVIYIPRADFFYIMGEVKNPGSYAFTKKDITIVEAISMAGGFTPIAARNKTRIVRLENEKEKIYNVNVDAITKSGKIIQSVPIKPNDLIVVPESFF
ncbi:MAG: polysaccharide biosynthesis/export family protein [Syntrophales bacterium]